MRAIQIYLEVHPQIKLGLVLMVLLGATAWWLAMLGATQRKGCDTEEHF